MNPTGRQRSTRDRPAKAPLSVEAVVDAALAILQSDGLEAISMRRVATALDTGPASLYVYVADRRELMEAAHDLALAGVEVPAEGDWRARLELLVDRVVASWDARTSHISPQGRPVVVQAGGSSDGKRLGVIVAHYSQNLPADWKLLTYSV